MYVLFLFASYLSIIQLNHLRRPHEPRFQSCCERAYGAALKLAAWASKYDSQSLKQYYEEGVKSGWFTSMSQVVPGWDDGESDSDADDEELAARNPCLGVMLLISVGKDLTGREWVRWRYNTFDSFRLLSVSLCFFVMLCQSLPSFVPQPPIVGYGWVYISLHFLDRRSRSSNVFNYSVFSHVKIKLFWFSMCIYT